ncbi:HNH endonuclease [Heyndrickxia oleronia]|uniref:HNH endonuclease n=1 Tax=Heyndrickxia oleronia TaxID=38875 RepID=UPI003F21CEA7
MRTSMPSNYQIFDYWKDKELEKHFPVILDWGEPCCWACNKPIIVETQQLLDKCDFKEIWNRTSGYLERCHIIAKALGGSYEPENLFLMCPDCHIESPDISDKQVFFNWIKNQRRDCIMGYNVRKLKEELYKCCEIHNVDVEEFSKFVCNSDQNLIINKINTHGFKYSDSTILYAWMSEYLNSRNEVCNT